MPGTLDKVLADLEYAQEALDDARFDDTSITQCTALTKARDLVLQTYVIVRSVMDEYDRDFGPRPQRPN
jgi:hypothetical protein